MNKIFWQAKRPSAGLKRPSAGSQHSFWTTIVLSVGTSLLMSGTASAELTRAELKIGITQEFENLNPLIMSMSATTYIYQMVGRSLVILDQNGKWVPQLAKKIPKLEDGSAKLTPDKKKIIAVWELKDNAVWGDGTPITCADFAFTREVGINDTVSVSSKETYTMLEKIDWDPKTPKKCTMTYDKARWDFYQMADFRPLPKHLEEPIFNQYKTQNQGYEKNTNYSRNPTLPGLYNGPYLISEVKLADHVTVVPNPKFYGEAPKFKKIQIKLIPNTGTLEANLRSNTIDKVSSLGFAFDQALAFEKKVKSEKLPYIVDFKASTTYEHIDLNLDNPLLKDVRVRKALVYAINREQLVKALFEGRQEVAIHNLAPIDSWYTKDPKHVVLYPYNRKEAAKLLEEAGFKLGSDGIRQKDGKRLSFTFMTTAGDKTRENVQVFLKDQWKAVGIDVQIKNQPAKVFFGDTTKNRKFDGMAMYAWESSPETSPKSNLHSTMIPTAANGWSGQNTCGYSNPKVDVLLDKLDLEFDANKRKALMAQILHYYTDEIPVIPLYYRSKVAVRPLGLTGFQLVGHQYAETNNVENWDVK